MKYCANCLLKNKKTEARIFRADIGLCPECYSEVEHLLHENYPEYETSMLKFGVIMREYNR